MICPGAIGAWPRASGGHPVPGSSTANRSRRRQKRSRGFDVHQQVNGRKRHILADTPGLILAVVVTAASVQDRDGARSVPEVLRHQFPRVRLIWADGAYAGDLAAWLRALRPWRKVRLEMVKRPKGVKGFRVLLWRWIVEWTFGWFGHYRRLSKDYEYLPHTSDTMIRTAIIHLMVRRLARTVPS
jgi:putative transposase